jgi:hypothetical protein
VTGIVRIAAALLFLASLDGCAVIAVADAAIAVAATTVKVGADVVGTAVHVTASGVKALTKDKEEPADPAKK